MSLFEPGAAIIYMKVGDHAREPLSAIIERKSAEIAKVGYTFWGFGGSTCHPRTIVQPFAEAFAKPERPVRLCLHSMPNEAYWGPAAVASEYSLDGIHFAAVPAGIQVLGSRYGFVVSNLRPADEELPLDRARVAIGASEGRAGSRYLEGRVDKACFVMMDEGTQSAEPKTVSISWVADLRRPFAVFLRGEQDSLADQPVR